MAIWVIRMVGSSVGFAQPARMSAAVHAIKSPVAAFFLNMMYS